ncbi:MAG: hypothetical protein V4484_04995 [Pseudomonadota bacterium]
MALSTCPKCSYQRLPSDAHIHAGVCPACGIAYQKFLDRQQRVPVEIEPVPQRGGQLTSRLLELPPALDGITVGARGLAWCALALWTAWFTLHGINWEIIGGSFLHNMILPFHEFGHVLFMPFGRFMTILGGSLFQVLMPLGLMVAFIVKQRDTFGAAVMLWWSGQSLVDLAPYIADAVHRYLPLVGGGGEASHDWGNLLTMLHLLEHTQALARTSFVLGVLVMLAGLAWGALLLRLQYAKMSALPRD